MFVKEYKIEGLTLKQEADNTTGERRNLFMAIGQLIKSLSTADTVHEDCRAVIFSG